MERARAHLSGVSACPSAAERIATLLPTLGPVRSVVGSRALHAVDVYYRTATDTALLAFRSSTPSRSRWSCSAT